MGELGALFNPGMRHELEERRAKAARREEEGNARDGDLRIDLESGVAVINIPGADEDSVDGDGVSEPGVSEDSVSEDGAGPASTPVSDAADAPASSTVCVDDSAAPQESADKSQRLAPALRPRGKRGMSTSSR